ncbi:hypothetical protein CUR178_02055 [Leishmania enriettii]|uniref:BEACH domain-containing protein n=1 Tax=Leishmania enriettii TaxID=5663 RepID=A0A836KLB2_LEIEN|nr:hypothetical protein CUR178_02055 [Leishmania enriettii]
MASLSERDLGRVEKLLNIIRSLLEYGKAHRHHERCAITMAPTSRASDLATTVTSPAAHTERQDQQVAACASTSTSERRLWTELAFLMSRVVAVQKLSLISYVTSDPDVMVAELARMLLTFLQESCGAAAGGGKEARLRHVALLAQDRLLFLLRIFCSLKNCTVMLSETSGRDNANAAWEVFNAICVHVISGQHLSWMSQIYVWFCDEAARRARSEDAMPSACVYATHDALCCILGCCGDHEECAKAFLYAEPVACVTYMFYGLKLRISAGDPLRPYEDKFPITGSGKGTVDDAAAQEVGAMNPDSDGSSSGTALKAATSDAMRAGPIPQRPLGASCLKTRYFTTLIASSTQQQQQQTPKESTSASVNSTTVTSLVRANSSHPTGGSTGTSWAFNQPELSRSQLKAVLLGGRDNAFDSLLFVALDIVIEVMRSTRDYGHWMVLSTVGNLLLLSKKRIEVGDTTAALASGPMPASASAVTQPLSQVVAMYENIMVLFQFLVSLMEGIGVEKSARSLFGSPFSASGSLSFTGMETGAKKGDESWRAPRPASSSPSCGLSPPAPFRAESSFNTGTCEMNQLLAATTLDNSSKLASVNTAHLREYLSQQIVHIVLQTDLHALLMAVTRILECDWTLFRVLHSFCVLEAQLNEPGKSAKGRGFHSASAELISGHQRRAANAPKVNGTTSLNRSISGGTITCAPDNPLGSMAGAGAFEDVTGSLPKLDAASRLFFIPNFGDVWCIADDTGCSDGLDGGLGDNAGSRSTSRVGAGTGSGHGSGLGDSGIIAQLGTMWMHSSASPNPPGPGQRLLHPQQQYRHLQSGAGDGGGGESFGKSFFRSFLGNLSSGFDAVPVTRSMGNMGIYGQTEQDSWAGSCASNSSCSGSSEDGSIRSCASDDDDLIREAMGTLRGSGTGSLLSPRSFGASGSSCRRALKAGTHHQHKSRVKAACSAWYEVPSYTALARELVRIFNLVLADAALSVDVRLGAGLLLPSIVLRDSRVFRLYEGRLLIRNYLSLLLQELQYNIKLPEMTTSATADGEDESHVSLGDAQERRQSTLNSAPASVSAPPQQRQLASSVMKSRAHLTQRELITFAAKVIKTLEHSFKVLGVIPLTSDVASITELPLYFCCTKGAAPLSAALERFFTRVVALWLIGLVGAQCDEDIDRRAMEVLLHLMNRAVVRGSLPKDSSRVLMVTPSGTTTAVQSGTTIGLAVLNGAAAVMSPLLWTPTTIDTFSSTFVAETEPGATAAAAKSMLHTEPQPPGSHIGLDAAEVDAETGLFRSHLNNSMPRTPELSGVKTGQDVDAGVAVCASTVEALSAVFRVLLGRMQEPLSPAPLTAVLSLFTSRDGNLLRLGRECVTHSLETPSVYSFYSDVILNSNAFLLTQVLSLLSAYLTSAALTPAARRTRRVWMLRFGCVDAVIRVLVRVLDSPQSTPNFMKVMPHLFQFLSAFESGDRRPPQLSSTNFIASVTERLGKLEGMEYFIIVTQAVLDASMGTHDHADGGRSRAHSTEVQVLGSFRVALYNCAAVKPIFLELLPSLLSFAKSHSHQLFANLVEVLYRILECTSIVRSERLANFALDHGLSQMLPYLELPGRFIEVRLPFAGTASDLHSFWQPILLRAPRRSSLRFTSHGGVQVSVGLWPNTGFSISTWFQFDRLYITIPLFEFRGVVSDGDGVAAALRGSTMAASLVVSGGDSVQLAFNSGQRVTISEGEVRQSFGPLRWVRVCAVLHATHILDVYVSGFKVGTTAFPYFAAGAEVRVNVGFTDAVPHDAVLLAAEASPLFSIGDIELWAQALSRSQIEAEFANGDDTRVTATLGGHRGAFRAKVREEGVPQEFTLLRHMGVAGGAPVPGPLGSAPNFSVGGLGALMSLKSHSATPSGVAGLSITTTSDGSMGAGGDCKDSMGPRSSGAWAASATRMARFVPLENEDDMLQNVLACPTGISVVAKLVGRYATPPKAWVNYPLLWASRGGLGRMLDWMHLVTSSAQLESLLKLILECFHCTTLAITLDPRTYVLFAYMLTNHAARYMTNAACDHLLELASSQISICDVGSRVIINRLAFEHILGDVGLYAAMRLDTALYLLQRVRHFFQSSQCRYAKHNARFVSPYRFVDRLLHSLIGAAAQTSLRLHRAVVKVAQQVVAACDMEDGLVQIFISLVALLTPEERVMTSRRNTQLRVVVPVMSSVTRDTVMPLRTANHLTRLMLSSLVECSSQSSCMSALSRAVDLPWYAVCLSRFADPVAVVYATRIFFEAAEHNPALHEEVAQHQSALVEVLVEHAAHEDLILLLLALTMGATRHIDILSHQHSLQQQLDSLLGTFSPEPNALIAPIFVRLFVVHLDRIARLPCDRSVRAEAMLHEEQRLSYRVRRYFSLARVCSRIMVLIMVRRRFAFLMRQELPAVGASSVGTPNLSVEHHVRVRSSGSASSSSRNVSFDYSSGAGVISGIATPRLTSASVASGDTHSCAPLGLSSKSPLGFDSATGAHCGEGDGAVTGVEYSVPHLQSLRGASEVARSLTSDGDGGFSDARDLPLPQTSFDGVVSLQRPVTLPASVVSIGDDDHGCSSGGDGEAQQWKPPVLLPDMWAKPAPSIPFPATPHEHTSGASSSTSTAEARDARSSPKIACTASTTKVVSRVSLCPSQHHVHPATSGADASGGGDRATAFVSKPANVSDGRSKEISELCARSSKYRRAFAVLRVTVLLWLSLQARRCRWVLKPRAQLYEEDFDRRFATTLFCIRTVHHFASMSTYFYLFVNSPLQAAALSSLVSCISREGLLEQFDMWDQLIRSLVVVPARGAAVMTATDTDAAVTRITASDKPQQQQEDKRVLRADTRLQESGSEAVEEREGRWKGTGALPREEEDIGSLSAMPYMASSAPVKATAAQSIALRSPCTTSSAYTGSVGRGSAHAEEEGESAPERPLPVLSAKAPQRLTLPRNITFRSAESSSTQLDNMTVLQSPLPSLTSRSEELEDAEVESTSLGRQLRGVTEDGNASSVTSDCFDPSALLSATSTRVSPRRLRALQVPLPFPEQCAAALSQHVYTEVQDDELVYSTGTGTAGVVTAERAAIAPNTAVTTARLVAANSAYAAKPYASDHDHSDDGTSSMSLAEVSVSSQRHAASSRATPSSASSMAPSAAAAAKQEVSAPNISFSALPAMPSTLRSHGLSEACAMGIARVTESAGEVVRRGAVSVLSALIRSSLDTLPVPNWIGGPTYGSCGGLLFQLLFVVSAKAAGENSTKTLVRYFLLCVGNAVKEQRDRDLMRVSHHEPAPPLPRGDSVRAPAPPEGLGGSLLDSAVAGDSVRSGTASPLSFACGTSTLSKALVSTTATGAGKSANSSAGGLITALPLVSATAPTVGVPPSMVSAPTVSAGDSGGGLAPLSAPAMTSSDSVGGGYSQRSGAPPARHSVPLLQSFRAPFIGGVGHAQQHSSSSSGSTSATGAYSDVFLFNVSHFTNLIVDMLAINVLELPMATHFFLTLLLLCQGWPNRYVDQLSWQVMRVCIAVLNRPSTQDASVGLIESVYALSTLVLRRGWAHKGVLESFLRVLYRLFVSLPPAWMPDADARHCKRLVTLILRHVVQTYAGTKELEKALAVRTLTQRLSFHDDFVMVFSLPNEDECCATFEQYCAGQFSSLDTLMSGRLKAKADLAFKASIKARGEYIKRIKAFSTQYTQAMEVPECYRRASLRVAYTSRFSSFVATTPRVDSSQLHWLLSATCVLRESHTASRTPPWRKTVGDRGAVVGVRTQQINPRDGVEGVIYHFMDPQMNYGELKGVRWEEGSASLMPIAGSTTSDTTASGAHSQSSGSGASVTDAATDLAESLMNASSASAKTKTVDKVDASAPTVTEEKPPKNDLIRATQCEELPLHIAVLVPPFSTRCCPHIGDGAFPTALKDLPVALTPSAVTLLRYLVAPHETVRFLSNGFRINGIHATPCLILLTNVTLKVIGFSRLTEAGDIILCENAADNNDGHSRCSTSVSKIRIHHDSPVVHQVDAVTFSEGQKGPAIKSARKNPFSMASMTRQLQRLFHDSPIKSRQQQDGTRVAQAMRQATSSNYQSIYWTYLVSSIRAVRSLHYMHLDTAVQVQLYYDNGPMLSVVDAKQSMNPSARKKLIKVLKDVVGTQQCTFIDESQRAASMRKHLVRWATGSLSNYEYLRFLNEVAGRTNRDLNQYPVFPWVLADYTSTTLDLESASTFRDFAYPMGAQTETRRAAVARLFENTREARDTETGKSYPFHHGTHYSTSGGVLYFLLRAQPFTTYARIFQGGDFDLAMRLFDSVAATFASCVTGPADCKELVPEFYVNGGFLANADHLNLGNKSDDEAVDDVRLPPWAKNSRQVFTAVMRYALECPYVVEHLHQWIDLVFGVRRRGPLALERYNVFQRMTYGEEVVQALKNAETPHDCDVIIAEVDNFGQTPPQLFQERHPSHRELSPVVKASPPDGGAMGGGATAWSSSRGNAAGGPAAPSPAMIAVTLGSRHTSFTATASSAETGSQFGTPISSSVSSSAFASGQTYTQAFRREAPKVMRMLIHAMDEAQTWFMLRDPPSGTLQHPPPSALTDTFRFNSHAVLDFSMLRTPKKLACVYAQLVPVADTNYYLCWHEREAQIMRYTIEQAAFHSVIAFNPRDENGALISAVAVGPRESVLLVATSCGTVSCLFPDDAGDGALHVCATLCYHRSPVTKIALESTRHRAVTITPSAGEDDPILWRVQRSGCCFLRRLRVEQLLPTPAHASISPPSETAAEAVEVRSVVDVAIDSVSGNVALVTARSLLIFDNNGEPFGAGTLPSPTSLLPAGTARLKDDNGDVGVAVSRPVLCVADITAVTFYQTSEWASGTGVLFTGHSDGSLSAWRTTRLPPHTVAPGKIAMVEFHSRLLSSTTVPMGSPTTSSVAGQQDAASMPTNTGGVNGNGSPFAVNAGSFGTRGASGGVNSAALGAAGTAASIGTGTGATNCPVTALHQENADVPTFFVGYANGTVRQLVLEDPALSLIGGSGGGGAGGGSGVKDSSGGGNAGDDPNRRR